MKIMGERKVVAARLSNLIGTKAVYTKMPCCAYVIGPFAIERDGSVTVPESADLAALRTLAQEGLLEGFAAMEEEQVEIAQDGDESNERPDDTENCVESAEETVSVENDEEENDEQYCTEDRPTTDDATENTDASVNASKDADPNEYCPDTAESENALAITIPLAGHTVTSLRNLVTMVYTRGPLLSKATGGSFSCPLALIDGLKDCLTVESVRSCLTPDLAGLTISDDTISFTGFPFTKDEEKKKAFTQLAAQMSRLAQKQKRVVAKAVDASNERYIFRIWLLAMGMVREEFKTARRVLLAPLSGSAAFKDAAMETRWKERRAAEKETRANMSNPS